MARAVYSCTKCRPVDTSIIEAYMVLVKTNESASRAESNRASAETARAEAETERTRVFSADHATAAGDHATAEQDHAVATQDHVLAARDHTYASSDHETSLSDHGTAALDHTTAEQDHSIALADHTAASADHATATADHATASSDHSASSEATGRANHAADVALEAAGTVGKYYGVFTSVSQLPTDDDTPGYALVGETSPLKVYNYDGTTWSDSGAVVDSLEGKSAYQVAVDEGYTGTEEEWLASLNGVGFLSVNSSQDGTIIITLTNGDTITVDLNHNHPAYPKYHLCADEAEYNAITTKDPQTLYLIPETSS